MRAIRSKNTLPELRIRRAMHSAGFRYGLHRKDLPGKPDLVFPKYSSVILVHGCFWHGHHGCQYFKLPVTRAEFWRKKIERNQLNDIKAIKLLIAAGWRVAVVWECSMKRHEAVADERTTEKLIRWLRGRRKTLILQGQTGAQ